MDSETATLVVGYALRPKRVQSFISPDLISYASSNGVKFLQIDPKRSLTEQGPFDLLLHKLDVRVHLSDQPAAEGLHRWFA